MVCRQGAKIGDRMKRYLLFSGADYYPSGGWHDFDSSFDTIAEAVDPQNTKRLYAAREWWHVVDFHTGQIVASDAPPLA